MDVDMRNWQCGHPFEKSGLRPWAVLIPFLHSVILFQNFVYILSAYQKIGSWLMYDDLTDVIKPNTIQPHTIQYNLTLSNTIHHNTVVVHEP